MLCASDPVSAQDAHRPSHSLEQPSLSSSSSPSYITHKPLLHDPHDPKVLTEYEDLVLQWTRQHVAPSSSSSAAAAAPSVETNSRASSVECPSREARLLHVIDRYLDEQWVDSQHIMQCAQAWNTRDSLNQMEAVRTVNILGLRMMQRLLQTRQELSSVFGTKNHNVICDTSSLSLSPLLPACQAETKTQHSRQRSSLTSSLDDEDDNQVMHAPLLRRHRTSRSSDEAGIIWSPGKLEKKKQEKALQEMTTTKMTGRPLRLVPSPSAPNCSTSSAQEQQEEQRQQLDYCVSADGFYKPATNYHWYYPRQDDYGKVCTASNGNLLLSDDNISSSSDESYGDTGYWRSWFSNEHSSGSESSSNNHPNICVFCNYPVHVKKSFSAGDAEHTQPMNRSSCSSTSYHSAHSPPQSSSSSNSHGMQSRASDSNVESVPEEVDEDDIYTALIQNYTHTTSNVIMRSESSISAFRPISKSLAPRCVPIAPSPSPPPSSLPIPSQQIDQQRRPSLLGTDYDNDDEDNSKTDNIPEASSSMPILTKSRSFPTKPFGKKSSDKSSVKDKNFVMRSFVSKKVSLTKLFAGGKK